MLVKAVVDTEKKVIYVQYPEAVIEYDLGLYDAALKNPRYFEEAENALHYELPEVTSDV